MDAAEAQAFVMQVAGMTKDGEQGPDRDEPFVMENDDAYDTVMGLISDARGIAGIPDPDPDE